MASTSQARSRAAAGQCIDCGIGTDRYRCDECRKIAAAYARKFYTKRTAAGQCINCGTETDRYRCAECRKIAAACERKSRVKRAAAAAEVA